MNITELTSLKAKVERLKGDANKAAGALEQHMKTLKTDFDCDTLEDAEEKLEKLRADAQKAEEKFDTALAAFHKKWEGKL